MAQQRDNGIQPTTTFTIATLMQNNETYGPLYLPFVSFRFLFYSGTLVVPVKPMHQDLHHLLLIWVSLCYYPDLNNEFNNVHVQVQ